MGNRLSKITTKTGDKGMTSFGGGCSLVSKGHPAIELIGSVDELNAYMGLLKVHLSEPHKAGIEAIQQKLFDLGGEVFMNRDDRRYVSKDDVEWLERVIGALNRRLPPLRDFVFPGATVGSAHAHVARTICRRAEINAVKYCNAHLDGIFPEYVRYLNRLSDYLFVLARYEAHMTRAEEKLWNRP